MSSGPKYDGADSPKQKHLGSRADGVGCPLAGLTNLGNSGLQLVVFWGVLGWVRLAQNEACSSVCGEQSNPPPTPFNSSSRNVSPVAEILSRPCLGTMRHLGTIENIGEIKGNKFRHCPDQG